MTTSKKFKTLGRRIMEALENHPHGGALLDGFINWGWRAVPEGEGLGIRPEAVANPIGAAGDGLMAEAIEARLADGVGPAGVRRLAAAALGANLGQGAESFFDITYQVDPGSRANHFARLSGVPAPQRFTGKARPGGVSFSATRIALARSFSC